MPQTVLMFYIYFNLLRDSKRFRFTNDGINPINAYYVVSKDGAEDTKYTVDYQISGKKQFFLPA